MTEPTRQPVTASSSSNTTSHVGQIAVFTLALVALLNAAFYFLSGVYFDDKRGNLLAAPITDEHIRSVRIAFALFTVTVGAAVFAVCLKPRWLSHGIATAVGVGSLIAGLYAFMTPLPSVLPIALFLIGALFPVLAWASLNRSRPAWAFLSALSAVYAVVLLFGAPKVRAQLEISLWTSLILPGLLVVATIGFALIRRDYREAA